MIEERKEYTLKVKDPLSFEIWIFRNGHGDDRRIFVVLMWRYATPRSCLMGGIISMFT